MSIDGFYQNSPAAKYDAQIGKFDRANLTCKKQVGDTVIVHDFSYLTDEKQMNRYIFQIPFDITPIRLTVTKVGVCVESYDKKTLLDTEIEYNGEKFYTKNEFLLLIPND